MNIASYIRFRDGDPSYDAMRELSIRSLHTNLKGLDDIDLLDVASDWRGSLRAWFIRIQQLNKKHTVLLVGSDSLVLEPIDFDWKQPGLVLPLPTGIGPTYRNCAFAYFEKGLPASLWEIGEKVWKTTTVEWDPDQHAWNEMYFAQKERDFSADLGFGFQTEVADSGMHGAPFRHYSASRDVVGTLQRMKYDLCGTTP